MRILFLACLITGCSTFNGTSGLNTSDYRGPDFDGAYQTSLDKYESPFTTAPAPQTSSHNFSLEWPILYPSKVNRGFQTDDPHYGVDFSGRRNAPILAAQTGRVIYAGRKFKGYGNLVILEHQDGIATFYAHLNKILVKEGQTITKGSKVGLMGRTGRATGVHLHFELRMAYAPVDPMPYFPSLKTSSN